MTRSRFTRTFLAAATCVTTLAAIATHPMSAATPPAQIKSYFPPYQSIGSVERIDPALDKLLAKDAVIERLAEGFNWSEGPVWIGTKGVLLFSDVPENIAYQWSPKAGVTVFHATSGFTGEKYDGKEQGSNGLTLDGKGRLVLCQHGDRRVSRLNDDGKTFTTIADRWEGRRFNSPNDVVFDRAGNAFFTDPPYGLPTNAKPEIDFHGVYRVTPDGKVTLISKELERPNGIALSPDQKILYVANSHGPRPIVMAFDLKADGTAGPGRVHVDMQPFYREGRRGAPDGCKVDEHGNLWATGPGGVLVFDPAGKLLGTILTGQATANCGWGDDGRTLYMTADGVLCKIRTKVKGTGF